MILQLHDNYKKLLFYTWKDLTIDGMGVKSLLFLFLFYTSIENDEFAANKKAE